VGRYLELADEALRRLRTPADEARESLEGTRPSRTQRSPIAVFATRDSDACSQCGRTDWTASLVMDDGTRLCAGCCLGRAR